MEKACVKCPELEGQVANCQFKIEKLGDEVAIKDRIIGSKGNSYSIVYLKDSQITRLERALTLKDDAHQVESHSHQATIENLNQTVTSLKNQIASRDETIRTKGNSY